MGNVNILEKLQQNNPNDLYEILLFLYQNQMTILEYLDLTIYQVHVGLVHPSYTWKRLMNLERLLEFFLLFYYMIYFKCE